ncbi:MAG TPA: VirB4 family type IV secretion/conjugal transfer ATPase [Steroidobacteraceae bacterium]|jgi:type IV secretion system protein VirB4
MLNARNFAVQREPWAAERIPYTAHVADSVIKTSFGDYLQVFRLAGASFESADDSQLNVWHERLNALWRNLAVPGVALWTHIVRRRHSVQFSSGYRNGFAASLGDLYYKRLANETLMVNEIYLSVVYRPAVGVATNALTRVVGRVQKQSSSVELADALDTCTQLAQTLQASLSRYEPQILRTYRHGTQWCSSILEFLSLLLNGEWQRVPMPRGPIADVLATSRLLFGTEAMEYRTPTETRVAALLGIKEYPTPSTVGMFDKLLSSAFPFVLTQSFAFLGKSASQALLQRQFHRMANAGDFAVSQAQELRQALDALTSNEFVMGDHHFSLQILADAGPQAHGEPHSRRLALLTEHVAQARSFLAETGMTVAREDLALEASFWAQLPGNFPMRVRKAPITSRNFAAMAPFHNYPVGRPLGNHWGEALALFATSARSPYYFSLHATDPSDPGGGARRDTGHTFLCGPTGSGKTVLIGFLISMLERQGVTQVILDKDRGLEILVRALDGEYLPLENGVPTGFNPLQLQTTPAHSEFLKSWLRVLARRPGDVPLTVREQADLDHALRGTLALEAGARRLSRLIEFLDPTESEGVHARLARWCASTRGEYAWVFDNARDSVGARLLSKSVVGFDVTDFLGNELTRAPVTLYLFHLIRQLLDGRRLVCWMDEFWRLLADPAFAGFAKDGPKTWRKLNGVMCFATQSASDVLESPISRTIVEQTPTKIFFPNDAAVAADYMEGFGLSEREFRLIRDQLEPGSRMFLLKQGHHSVLCRLDLQGFDEPLAVISGRAATVQCVRQLIAKAGPRSQAWLPLFYQSLQGSERS